MHRGRPTNTTDSVRAVEHVFCIAHASVAELPQCQFGALATVNELVDDRTGVQQRLVDRTDKALYLIRTGLHEDRVIKGNEHVPQFHAGAA